MSIKKNNNFFIMRVGLCIPCTGNHMLYLEKCLDCINNQIVKPDIISISISDYKDQKINMNTNIPIILQITKEKRCASENRNIAVNNIYKQVDILSFMDADDFIHPQKIQQVHKYFSDPSVDCFVHEFLEYPKKDHFKFDELTFSWPEIDGRLCNFRHELIRDSTCGRLYLYEADNGNKIIHANGHMTCKIKVWKDLKWPENYKTIGEDSEYNFLVFLKGYKYVVSKDKLSFYCV